MTAVRYINMVITIVFFVCYSYQFAYILVPLFVKPRIRAPEKKHRYAVLVSARNEEAVIGELLDSISAQTYDRDLVTVFVCADNCDDMTAAVAQEHGAVVYPRFNRQRVGKGYALEYMLDRIRSQYPADAFDGFFVFDADNVLDENYITEMNRSFSDGNEIVTSLRNSKNYGDNWISAGYALWFLRESQFLNRPRALLGTSAAVSGTGFLFSRDVLNSTDGWKFFLLTEDIEFTIHHITEGRKIGYCEKAVIYDEQPTGFRQSWRQRLRWAKGYLQVFQKDGDKLLRGILHGSFSCFDMTMAIMPAAILSVLGLIVNSGAAVARAVAGQDPAAVLGSVAGLLCSACGTVFVLGIVTTITEWKRIYAPAWKKVLYALTFPLFMLTYIPISLYALVCRDVGWKPIVHTRARSLGEIRGCVESSRAA